MTRSLKWLIMAACCVSAPAYAPWGVGNGGDALRLAFAHAKEHAASLTARVNERALRGAPEDVKRWILDNQERLAGAILGARHVWTMDEKPTCAWVSHGDDVGGDDPTAVYLSYPTCRRLIDDYREAGELLVHESVHHLDVTDESFADQVAMNIYGAAAAGLLDWQPIASSLPAREMHAAVWTGAEMLVVGGLDGNGKSLADLWSYDPKRDLWRELASAPEPRRGHLAIWAEDKLIVWGGFEGDGNLWRNDGALYDWQTGTWTRLTPPGGPDSFAVVESRGAGQTLVWTGEEALIFGGVASRKNVLPGYRYDPRAKRWSTFAVGPHQVKQGHSAVWADGKMIVWGGVDAGNFDLDTGAIFDPDTGAWRELPVRGAPGSRWGHTAVWTGSKMIVWGGWSRRSFSSGDGGVYDPQRDEWEPFTTETALNRIHHSGVWTGRELLIYGGTFRGSYFRSVVAYDPERRTWRSVEQEHGIAPRAHHAAVWTGSGMLVFGGRSPEGVLRNGGLFLP